MQKILFLLLIGAFSCFSYADDDSGAVSSAYDCASLSTSELLDLVEKGVFVFNEDQGIVGGRFYARPIAGGTACQGEITASFFELPGTIVENLNEKRVSCGLEPVDGTQPIVVAQPTAPPSQNWVEGCEILEGGISASEKTAAKTCLNNIKATIRRGSSDRRATVFTNMFSRLNEHEQRFAAMVFTAVGEAEVLTPPKEEFTSIMKVLENRKNYARRRGVRGASELGAALQDWQFSMYNRNERRWRQVILNKNMLSDRKISMAIDAYAAFDDSTFSPSSISDDVYHYYSTIIRSPRWARGKRERSLTINGEAIDGRNGTRHKFYPNIAWSYREPSFNR